MSVEFKKAPESDAGLSWTDLKDGDVVKSISSGRWYVVAIQYGFEGLITLDAKKVDSVRLKHVGASIRFYRLQKGDTLTITGNW